MAETIIAKRLIEAGAYRSMADMIYLLHKTPLISVSMPGSPENNPQHFIEAPFLELEQMSRPLILAPEQIGELMAKKNELDSMIQWDYEVKSYNYDEHIDVTSENDMDHWGLITKKTYLLLGTDKKAKTSELIIQSELNKTINAFKRLTLTVNIQGLLAGQGSPLVKNIVDYIKKYDLSLMDNRITTESGETYFVEGSVKTRMIEKVRSDTQIAEFKNLVKPASPADLKNKISNYEHKEIFNNGFDRAYRLKIIKE